MILLENEYASIEYYREAGFISVVWKKYAPSPVYREVVSALYKFRTELAAPNLLSDNRLMPSISEADGHWTVEIAKQYYPFIAQSRIALVVSESSFMHLAIRSMQDELKMTQREYGGKSRTQYFSTVEEARAWLAEDTAE